MVEIFMHINPQKNMSCCTVKQKEHREKRFGGVMWNKLPKVGRYSIHLWLTVSLQSVEGGFAAAWRCNWNFIDH